MNHNTKDHDKYADGGPPASFHARSSSVRENYSPSPRQEICPQRASTVHSAQQLSLHHAMSPHVSVAQPTHPDLARRLPPASSTGGRASSINHRSYQIYPYHSVDHGPFSPPHTPAEEIVHFYAPSGGPRKALPCSQVNLHELMRRFPQRPLRSPKSMRCSLPLQGRSTIHMLME